MTIAALQFSLLAIAWLAIAGFAWLFLYAAFAFLLRRDGEMADALARACFFLALLQALILWVLR